jgi:hypothetical protein
MRLVRIRLTAPCAPGVNPRKRLKNEVPEVKMMREQINGMDTERQRELEQLGDQIGALKEYTERQS